jgi:hypothetical protein
VKLLPVEARRFDDFEGAFAKIASAGSDALLLSADALIFRNPQAPDTRYPRYIQFGNLRRLVDW